MFRKYHISPKTHQPEVCNADKRHCTYQHFSSKAKAIEYLEQVHELSHESHRLHKKQDPTVMHELHDITLTRKTFDASRDSFPESVFDHPKERAQAEAVFDSSRYQLDGLGKDLDGSVQTLVIPSDDSTDVTDYPFIRHPSADFIKHHMEQASHHTGERLPKVYYENIDRFPATSAIAYQGGSLSVFAADGRRLDVTYDGTREYTPFEAGLQRFTLS